MPRYREKKRRLMNEIELKRKKMHEYSELYGFGHDLVVACSKRLDKLIVEYQKLEYNDVKKPNKDQA